VNGYEKLSPPLLISLSFIFFYKRYSLKEKFGSGPHPIEQPFLYHFLKTIASEKFLFHKQSRLAFKIVKIKNIILTI